MRKSIAFDREALEQEVYEIRSRICSVLRKHHKKNGRVETDWEDVMTSIHLNSAAAIEVIAIQYGCLEDVTLREKYIDQIVGKVRLIIEDALSAARAAGITHDIVPPSTH